MSLIGLFGFVIVFIKILLAACNDKLWIKLIKGHFAYGKFDVDVKMQVIFVQF